MKQTIEYLDKYCKQKGKALVLSGGLYRGIKRDTYPYKTELKHYKYGLAFIELK